MVPLGGYTSLATRVLVLGLAAMSLISCSASRRAVVRHARYFASAPTAPDWP